MRRPCLALLAVLLFSPVNYQRSTPRSRRKNWAVDGSANKKQQGASLFCHCFPLFLWINRTVAKVALLWQAVSVRRLIDLNICDDIIKVMFSQYNKCLFSTARHCRAPRAGRPRP
jgi:hypothetical protein